MKAIKYNEYGSTDMLHPGEVAKPIPGDQEVLMKVYAASVNSWDWDMVIGKPLIYRLLFGLFKPKYNITGSDVAGKVEAVGKNVNNFKPGDEVFGDISGSGFGTFAEYACGHEKYLAFKPKEMSYENAAAIPQAGVLALQGLRQGMIQEGQQVLINGAGGGVGSFAIQLAKLWGTEVTAVDRGGKLDFMKSLGADHVMDFTRHNYTKSGKQYDLVLDMIAKHSVFNYRHALKRNGHFVLIGGSVSTMFQVVLLGYIVGLKAKQKIALMPYKPNRKDLEFLSDLFVEGKLKPVIDQIYSLDETPKAIQYLGDGYVKGKLVISMK